MTGGIGPSDLETKILITTQAQLADLKKAKDGIKSLGKTTDDTNKSFGQGIKEMQYGLRSMLSPLTMIRRSIFLIGTAWALTIGGLIAIAAQYSNKLIEIDKLAKVYGKTAQEVAREMYGMTITDVQIEQAKKFKYEMDKLQVTVGNIGSSIGKTFVENLNIIIDGFRKIDTYAAVSRNVAEQFTSDYTAQLNRQIKVVKELDNARFESNVKALLNGKKIQENYKSELAYSIEVLKLKRLRESGGGTLAGTREIQKRINEQFESAKKSNEEQLKSDILNLANAEKSKASWALEKSYRIEILKLKGDERGLLKETLADKQIEINLLDNFGAKTKVYFEEWKKLQQESLERSKWGFKSYIESITAMQKQFGQNTQKMFSDVFIDALDNKLANAKQIFADFFKEIRNMAIRLMTEQAVAKIFGMIANVVIGGTGNATASVAASSVTSAAVQSSAASSGANMTTYYPSAGHATGGWVGLNGPERALVGEREPELVVPASKLNQMGGNGGGNTVQNYYYISAIDASSFAEFVARNPNSIVAVTSNAIQKNKQLRRTIKEYS